MFFITTITRDSPIGSTREQGKPTLFQDMYALAIIINHCYWKHDHKYHYARQVEKKTLESHSQGLWCFSNCFWETLRKIESNHQNSTQTEGYIELPCAALSLIWLNPSTLSDLHSLFVSLTFLLILGQDHLNKILFWALVDSKSTHCFVDSKFVDTHHLKTSATPPVVLCLFDGSLHSTISKTANLPIIFPTNNCIDLDFYVTPLDSSCSLVLGYNWLTWHNLLIDWANGLINFYLSLQENLAPSHIVANTLLASPSSFDTSL